ncbi:MAG: hypothetical protein ACREBH_00405, partial [Candidatus Micrarchaeaceae archaeon]
MAQIYIDNILEVCKELIGDKMELVPNGRHTTAITTNNRATVHAVFQNNHLGRKMPLPQEFVNNI